MWCGGEGPPLDPPLHLLWPRLLYVLSCCRVHGFLLLPLCVKVLCLVHVLWCSSSCPF